MKGIPLCFFCGNGFDGGRIINALLGRRQRRSKMDRQKIDLCVSVELSGVQIAGTMPEKLAKLRKKHHILNSIAISRKKTGQ